MKTFFKNKIVITIIALAVIWFGYSALTKDTDSIVSPVDLVTLSLDMEKTLGVEDVVMNEMADSVLEVRVKAPVDTSKEILTAGAAYMFGYIEPSLKDSFETVRIIYTENNLDKYVVEASRDDISSWLNKKIDDKAFGARVKYITIGK